MKTTFILLISTMSLFASSIQEMQQRTQQINDSRNIQREILSMDTDMREYKRASVVKKRKVQSVTISKMIQLRDHTRG